MNKRLAGLFVSAVALAGCDKISNSFMTDSDLFGAADKIIAQHRATISDPIITNAHIPEEGHCYFVYKFAPGPTLIYKDAEKGVQSVSTEKYSLNLNDCDRGLGEAFNNKGDAQRALEIEVNREIERVEAFIEGFKQDLSDGSFVRKSDGIAVSLAPYG